MTDTPKMSHNTTGNGLPPLADIVRGLLRYARMCEPDIVDRDTDDDSERRFKERDDAVELAERWLAMEATR